MTQPVSVVTTFSPQVPSAIIMVRPHRFKINPETGADNLFQLQDRAEENFASTAYAEISAAAEALERAGVRVHLFDDLTDDTPDSVFPNNWFSTHPGGHVAVYPMKCESRRAERRQDILTMLKRDYRVQDIVDYSGLEEDGLYLEGTGAMVLDHVQRIAYAAQSDRTNPIVLERFCTQFHYEPLVFDARDPSGFPIYHTNVLMCIGTSFALIGLSAIVDERRRKEIATRLRNSGRTIIELTPGQIASFAGNALELQGVDRRILALSATAYRALSTEQLELIRESADMLALDIPTIEKAGGSVRCTMAGVHLLKR